MDVNLKCVSEAAAAECAEFLRGKGIRHVDQRGDRVLTALMPNSVISLAEDAFERGWSNDGDCAAIIAAMG